MVQRAYARAHTHITSQTIWDTNKRRCQYTPYIHYTPQHLTHIHTRIHTNHLQPTGAKDWSVMQEVTFRLISQVLDNPFQRPNICAVPPGLCWWGKGLLPSKWLPRADHQARNSRSGNLPFQVSRNKTADVIPARTRKGEHSGRPPPYLPSHWNAWLG